MSMTEFAVISPNGRIAPQLKCGQNCLAAHTRISAIITPSAKLCSVLLHCILHCPGAMRLTMTQPPRRCYETAPRLRQPPPHSCSGCRRRLASRRLPPTPTAWALIPPRVGTGGWKTRTRTRTSGSCRRCAYLPLCSLAIPEDLLFVASSPTPISTSPSRRPAERATAAPQAKPPPTPRRGAAGAPPVPHGVRKRRRHRQRRGGAPPAPAAAPPAVASPIHPASSA